MHAAAFSRGEGRAMGSVLDEVAATDSVQAAFTSVVMDGAAKR